MMIGKAPIGCAQVGPVLVVPGLFQRMPAAWACWSA